MNKIWLVSYHIQRTYHSPHRINLSFSSIQFKTNNYKKRNIRILIKRQGQLERQPLRPEATIIIEDDDDDNDNVVIMITMMMMITTTLTIVITIRMDGLGQQQRWQK